MSADAFFDTNTLLYLISADERKASQTQHLIQGGGTISVQVLNEFSNVCLRKHALSWGEIGEVLTPIRMLCRIVPLTVETHDRAVLVARRYRYRIYDALIIASALGAGCTTLYSEDMQDGQILDTVLTIRDPFSA
jgi:predicted nucleic acid-binding protein